MDYGMLCQKRDQLNQLYEQIPKEALLSFDKSFEIEYTHNSTAIEGNTLSLIQTKTVLEDGISVGGKPLREIYEVVNHNKAFGFVKQCVAEEKVLNLKNESRKFGEDTVIGISIQKKIIKTKATLTGVNLSSYKLFPPQSFAYVPDTSRRGDKISIAFNTSKEVYLVSPISIVFEVLDRNAIIPEYLFMYFNRPEFDRYARFNSWGSARETFSWEDMCDIDIKLPNITAQQKYVAIYNSILTNQHCYEQGLEDLKWVCEGYIERLRKISVLESIGQYLILSDARNERGLGTGAVRGLAVSKEMIATKADIDGVNLDNYKIVPPKYIAYVPDTSRRGDKMSLGYNNTNETFLVSSISIVFGTKQEKLLPEYLMLFFCRSEIDRYARFHSWGSARETFDWSEMCEVKIPIPDIKVQQSIVNIYNAYIERKAINDKLKEQIKDICPILIKGSLEEAGGKDE